MKLLRMAVIAFLALALWSPPSIAAAGSGDLSLLVSTDKGAVRGKRANGVDSFLGIPYAAPPVGRLRWRPPQPHARWDVIRDATHYGSRCAALASTNGPRTNAENCLFVNVQRPTGVTASRRLPVYVFIHGGGLVNGSSNQAGGGKFVRESNAVVVSMNYRLGVFGFLGLAGMKGDRGGGNFGFLDQQAALRWVRDNISAFGGDPDRVTVGGESAGGFSVCGHLVARSSRGLFARAMIQSGACLSRPVSETESASRDFAAAAGCAHGSAVLRCLRSMSAADLLDASASFEPSLTSGTAVFPEPPDQAVRAGRFARVPVVNGSNRDEGRTFMAGAIGWSRHQYVGWLRSLAGDLTPRILRRYPWPAQSDRFTAAYLSGAIVTDSGIYGIGGCATLQLDRTLARWVPTYAYEFHARRGPGLTPIPGYVWGAGHAAELAYLFPSFDNGTPIAPTFNAGERQLSRDMIRWWSAFVFAGRPNAQGLPTWRAFNADHQIMSLRPGGRSHLESAASFRRAHQCGFWNSLLQSPADARLLAARPLA